MNPEEVTFDNRTMEQKFAQITFDNQVNQMSHEQAQQFLMYIHKMNTIKENSYMAILKTAWFGDLIYRRFG
jgi:hypothetical protein